MSASLNDELAKKIEEMSDKVEASEKNTKKKRNGWIIAAIIAGSILVLAFIAYAIIAQRYSKVFFGSTYINGLDCGEKSPDEVRTLINDGCQNYVLTVVSRDRDNETIKATEVELHRTANDELDSILENQNKWNWLLERHNIKTFEIPAVIELNDSKLEEICKNMPAFDDSTAKAPVNAKIGDYDPNVNGYLIVPEYDGNRIVDKETAYACIKDSILTLTDTCDLNDYDIYTKAEISSDNPGLVQEKKNRDRFVGTKITYIGSDIVLDGNTIKDWVISDELGVITLDEAKLAEFVDDLATNYDTVGMPRQLVTQYGNEVTVSGGNFGWEVNKEAEIADLKVLIPETTVKEKEPIFTTRAISFDNEWGNTYVEINLAKQHLFLVKDGKCILESDIVSGGLQRRAPTPVGVYSIFYKGLHAVLRGPRRADGSYEYESKVTYWMPFNKGIGLHDATWRKSFGGNIYKYNGSHGCINLPFSKAKEIYANVEKGTPVIVYDEDFTPLHDPVIEGAEKETKVEKKTTTTKKKTTQTTPVQETVAETQAETPAETQPESQTEFGPAFVDIDKVQIDTTTNVENYSGE